MTTVTRVPICCCEQSLQTQTHLNAFFTSLALNSLLSGRKTLKLEDLTIIQRKVLVRIPWTGAETTQATVALKAHTGSHVTRGVDLVWKVRVVMLSTLPVPNVRLVPTKSVMGEEDTH